MAEVMYLIAVPFQPLLEQITDCVGLGKPVYQITDFLGNKVSVKIQSKSGNEDYVYDGGECGKLKRSAEKAAELAIHGLMDLYDVAVEDFTVEQIRSYKRCATLLRMKRRPLGISDGNEALGANQSLLATGSGLPMHSVTLEYKLFLKTILRRTSAAISPIMTLEFSGEHYFSWTMVTFPPSEELPECIFGDTRPECEAAE
ncbi:uncharacterized protein LOC110723557 [Chenopodium quinoa]|uniref:uncharacterized protein LOC110723557 n=1 Tax=Chenopodium quinoa TaxID=63459 RepID=UPI000B784325|nr:uncharacterized protein LOC110723557 [Chenopodium quinoa]